jgi:hypothetical protein
MRAISSVWDVSEYTVNGRFRGREPLTEAQIEDPLEGLSQDQVGSAHRQDPNDAESWSSALERHWAMAHTYVGSLPTPCRSPAAAS